MRPASYRPAKRGSLAGTESPLHPDFPRGMIRIANQCSPRHCLSLSLAGFRQIPHRRLLLLCDLHNFVALVQKLEDGYPLFLKFCTFFQCCDWASLGCNNWCQLSINFIKKPRKDTKR